MALYQHGIASHLDAIAMHPYTFPWSPNVEATWNPFYMLGYTHLIMAANGEGANPIWATESGYGTGHDGQSLDDATQAFRFGELIDAWRRLSYSGTLFIYGYRDTANNLSSVWDNMGLVRRDFSPKQSLLAFRNAAVGATATPRPTRPCISGAPSGGRRGRRARGSC